MKRFLFLISLSGILAISCEKVNTIVVEEPVDPHAGSYLFTINANTDTEETKTAYAGEVTFSWSDGDQISVLFHNTEAGHENENAFFTLTTTTGGSNSASFSGYVTNGWEIGASDGEHVKWALYPASAGHTYTVGGTYPVSFNIPAETDFTATHESANLPMWANGDGSNNFAFKHLTGCYKFEFTDLEVSKVKLVVENVGNGYYLSGTAAIRPTGSDYYWYSYEGSGSKTVSYISAVDPITKKATFYVPYRLWEGLTPKITLLNQDDGANKDYILLQATGKGALKSTSLTRITIIPSVSVPGTGSPIISNFGVDWATAATACGSGIIRNISAKADASYLYMLLDFVKSGMILNASYSHAHKLYFYLSDGDATGTSDVWTTKYDWYSTSNYDWLVLSGNVVLDLFDGLQRVIIGKNIAVNDSSDAVYLEMKIDRSVPVIDGTDSGYSTLSPAAGYLDGTSVYVGVQINDQYIEGGSWKGGSRVGYGPASGASMLGVTMPTYVAP